MPKVNAFHIVSNELAEHGSGTNDAPPGAQRQPAESVGRQPVSLPATYGTDFTSHLARAHMTIKMIATVCRRPGMTHAEYVTHITQVHAALTLENPVTLKSYVQNLVLDSAYGADGDPTHRLLVSRDSVTELYWDSLEAMAQTFAHPHVQQRVGPDGPRFADVRTGLNLIAAEQELPVPAAGPGSAKAMHFLRMAPGLDLQAFFERWTTAHEQVLEHDPLLAQTLRRCVQSRQEPRGNEMLGYFGADETRHYEGVNSLWFDDAHSLGLFRRYETALRAFNARQDRHFYLPAESFFVYAHENRVL